MYASKRKKISPKLAVALNRRQSAPSNLALMRKVSVTNQNRVRKGFRRVSSFTGGRGRLENLEEEEEEEENNEDSTMKKKRV